MRFLLPAALFSLACLALSQPTQGARSIMASAMQELGRYDRATLVIDGSRTVGNSQPTQYAITAHVNFQPVQGQPAARMEMWHWVEGNPIKRIVGDGTLLWTYDYTRNVYWSDRYGNFDFGQPADLRTRMLNAFRRRATGHETFLARTLVDAHGTSPTAMRTTPLSQNWVAYIASAKAWEQGSNVIAQATTPNPIDLIYHADAPTVSNPNYLLTHVEYWDRKTVANNQVLDYWRTDLYRNNPPAWLPISFTFVPPQGSTPMSTGDGGGW